MGGGVAGGVAGAGFGAAVALRAGGARVAKYAPCTSSSSSENSDPSGSTSIAHAAAMPTLLCRERGTFVASAEGETQVKGALCSSRRPQAMRARGWPRPRGASGQRGVEHNKPIIREADAPRISLVACGLHAKLGSSQLAQSAQVRTALSTNENARSLGLADAGLVALRASLAGFLELDSDSDSRFSSHNRRLAKVS